MPGVFLTASRSTLNTTCWQTHWANVTLERSVWQLLIIMVFAACQLQGEVPRTQHWLVHNIHGSHKGLMNLPGQHPLLLFTYCINEETNARIGKASSAFVRLQCTLFSVGMLGCESVYKTLQSLQSHCPPYPALRKWDLGCVPEASKETESLSP